MHAYAEDIYISNQDKHNAVYQLKLHDGLKSKGMTLSKAKIERELKTRMLT